MPEFLARVSTHLLIPVLFGTWLAHFSGKSRIEWAIDVLLFWSYGVLVFLAGSWPALAYAARYVPLIALLAGTAWGAPRLASLPVRPPSRLRPGVLGILALVLALAALQAVLAQSPGAPTVPLAFPLRDGTYCVLEGGRHPWVNRYAAVDSVRSAIEFARLGSWGRIDPEADPVVFSPLSGTVTAVSNGTVSIVGLAMAEDARTDSSAAAREVVVRLWPLGSLEVGIGEQVSPETRLGRVEPGRWGIRALVVAADVGARPTPIRFDGSYLARNALFRAPRTPQTGRSGPGTDSTTTG